MDLETRSSGCRNCDLYAILRGSHFRVSFGLVHFQLIYSFNKFNSLVILEPLSRLRLSRSQFYLCAYAWGSS